MKKIISTLFIVLIAVVGLSSCRGGGAKKATEIVKKYSGKVFKSSEKNALMLRHGDDVVRHLDFQKVKMYRMWRRWTNMEWDMQCLLG